MWERALCGIYFSFFWLFTQQKYKYTIVRMIKLTHPKDLRKLFDLEFS